MENEFRKYTKIENSNRTAFRNRIEEAGLLSEEWVATEKAHGANFQFMYNGRGKVEIASRTAKLSEGKKFYDCWSVYDIYEDNIIKMFNDVLKLKPGESLAVYGELLGQGVQKEVFYKDVQDFYGFDIKVNGRWLDVDTKNEVFEKSEIPFAKILCRGTLEECLAYPNDFDSKIPAILGGKNIEDNIAEGTVITTVKVKRAILKNKNIKFKEKCNAPRVPRAKYEFTDEGTEVCNELSKYICENRLRNVLSKTGQVTSKEFALLHKNLMDDALEDFKQDFPDLWSSVDKAEKRQVTKSCGRIATEMIRKDFVAIIDGIW